METHILDMRHQLCPIPIRTQNTVARLNDGECLR